MIVAGFLRDETNKNKYLPAILINEKVLCTFEVFNAVMSMTFIEENENLNWVKYHIWDSNENFIAARCWLGKEVEIICEENKCNNSADPLNTSFDLLELNDDVLSLDSSKIKMTPHAKPRQALDLKKLTI